MAIKYGQTIEWTDWDGTITSLTVQDYDTPEEARQASMSDANREPLTGG